MSPHEIYDPDTGKLEERRSYVPAIASISSALMFGAVAYWGVATGGGVLAPGPPTLPDEAAGPPNAPIINLVQAAGDSVTFRLDMSDFAGSQDDTHDSTRILVDSAGDDFTSPLVDSTTGPQTTDTISHGFAHQGVYDFRALYRGASGGWSDTSAVFQKTVSFDPGQITTLSVVDQTTDSLKLEWVTVHNGQGAKANHTRRYKNVTGDTASFSWGGSQEFASEVFDSLGTNIGDTVSVWVTGLTSGDTYEFGIKAYSGTPNVDANYGATSNIASGTVVSGTPQDTTDTPSIAASVTDSSNVDLTGSGFSGGNQTHDSTKWEVSRYSGSFSTLIDSTSAAALTSITVSSNSVFKADTTYAARATYYGSSDASGVSDTVAFTMTQPSEGSGDHPNEPTGMTAYVDRPFIESLPASSEAWSPTEYDHANVSVVTSGYAGTPPNGSSVLRLRYPEGEKSGGENGRKAETYPFSGKQTVYLYFSLQVADSFQLHKSNTNKITYFRISNPGSGVGSVAFLNLYGGGGGNAFTTPEIRVNIQKGPTVCPDTPDFTTILPANTGASSSVSRGAWHDIEALMTYESSPGQCDGSVEIWVNGTKTHNYTQAAFGDSNDGPGFRGLDQASVWGGALNSDTVTVGSSYLYIGHEYLSAKD